MAAERFRLGVNYWPAETAMDWLAAYDGDVVRRDLALVAVAGMDTVRVFVRWEDVQPTADTIDRATLAALVDTAEAAAHAGVELIVTLFTGHMSGVNWLPGWATGGGLADPRFRVVSAGAVQAGPATARNWYDDPAVVDAHTKVASSVSSALAGHPAVWAWDLGNENSNVTVPSTPAAAERWLDRMTSTIRANDPGRPITVGTHLEDLEQDRKLGPAEAARWCDFVCMHGYPAYAPWAAGPLDDTLAPFLTKVTAWLAGGAPVLFEEFGQSTVPAGTPPDAIRVSEAGAAAYTGRTLDKLWPAGAIGALLWCFADYAPALHHRAPFDLAVHERSFGLWRCDHSPKPAVQEITARSGRRCRDRATTDPWLDITTGEFAADRQNQLARLYRRYRAAAAAPG